MPNNRTKALKRKTPLVSRTAIVRKSKLRPKRKKPLPPMERFHHERLRTGVGCLVTGQTGAHVTIHHVTAPIHGGRRSRCDRRVVPLLREYHQHDYGLESVERLSHRGFYERHGIDLWAEAERLWAESEALWLERKAA